MKKSFILAALCMLILCNIHLQAAEGLSWAFIFNLQDLLLDVGEYNDGIQGGAGIKIWPIPKIALRALIHLNVTSDLTVEPAETLTTFGISGAFEYHHLKKDVSPYIGGLIGIHIFPNFVENQNQLDFYLEGIFGAELKIKDYLSVYAEYALQALFTADAVSLNLGLGNNTQVGLLFYTKK